MITQNTRYPRVFHVSLGEPCLSTGFYYATDEDDEPSVFDLASNGPFETAEQCSAHRLCYGLIGVKA